MNKAVFYIIVVLLLAACSSSQKSGQKTALFSYKSTPSSPATKSPSKKNRQEKKEVSSEKKKPKETQMAVSFDDDTPKPVSQKELLKESCPDNKSLRIEIQKWLGTPHKIGGCSTSGIDCSCFVIQIYNNVYGISLNRSSVDMLKDVEQVNRNDLKEGDILFFKAGKNRINHVGIYLNDDKFVHSSTSKGVIISSLSEDYWKKSYATAGRHKNIK